MATALGGSNATALIEEAYADDASTYNASLLVCLPKKKAGSLEDGTDFFDAEATRPLALVNADNRLIANACRCRWEEIFNECVSQQLQGPFCVEDLCSPTSSTSTRL